MKRNRHNFFILGMGLLSTMGCAQGFSTPEPISEETEVISEQDPRWIAANKEWMDLTRAYPGKVTYLMRLCWAHYTDDLPSYLPNLPKGTLVVLDWDEGMQISRDALFNSRDWKELLSKIPRQKAIELIMKGIPSVPISPALPTLIAQWKSQGINVIALSKRSEISDKDIDESGYALEKSWETNTPKLPSPLLFHKGILLCGDIPPEKALGDFLDALKTPPTHLVFIDRLGQTQQLIPYSVKTHLLGSALAAKRHNQNIPSLILFCLKGRLRTDLLPSLTPYERKRAELQLEHYL